MSKANLARLLIDPAAPPDKVANQKRLVLKWLAGTQPSVESATRLSDIFAKPSDFFLPQAPATPDEQAARLAQELARRLLGPSPEPIEGSLDREGIVQLLPHLREKYVLVDYVQTITPGEYVSAWWHPRESGWEPGEFYDNEDLIPGFVLAEALSQTAAIALLARSKSRSSVVFLAAYNGMRFRRMVHVGDEIKLEATITHVAGAIVHAQVEATVGDDVAVHGGVTLALGGA
jgi:3-hydroxyacyl-[acyl-carrier-protein] dehydratase